MNAPSRPADASTTTSRLKPWPTIQLTEMPGQPGRRTVQISQGQWIKNLLTINPKNRKILSEDDRYNHAAIRGGHRAPRSTSVRRWRALNDRFLIDFELLRLAVKQL